MNKILPKIMTLAKSIEKAPKETSEEEVTYLVDSFEEKSRFARRTILEALIRTLSLKELITEGVISCFGEGITDVDYDVRRMAYEGWNILVNRYPEKLKDGHLDKIVENIEKADPVDRRAAVITLTQAINNLNISLEVIEKLVQTTKEKIPIVRKISTISLGKILKVDLSNRGLRKLDLELFAKMKNLEQLYLEKNEIETLDLTPLAFNRKLQVLKVDPEVRLIWKEETIYSGKCPPAFEPLKERIESEQMTIDSFF
ncbi:MAG: hypothetical protein KAR35_05695 [Candidatus Heimdallarchaeota archaeon]|nr:hypothetical protein [Candidatus Heimdallarchaeota archaeon]MCK5048852.1 hypothetical protein [Candidatus Heimdallarchaeota archaeon]